MLIAFDLLDLIKGTTKIAMRPKFSSYATEPMQDKEKPAQSQFLTVILQYAILICIKENFNGNGNLVTNLKITATRCSHNIVIAATFP